MFLPSTKKVAFTPYLAKSIQSLRGCSWIWTIVKGQGYNFLFFLAKYALVEFSILSLIDKKTQ